MKQNLIFSAGRIVAMVLVMMLTFSLTGCSKDDPEGSTTKDQKSIVGTWVNANLTYSFRSDGTGDYDNGADVWGDIKYNMSGNTV